jgi:formylglycine-generating enzyme required for sulfatase activity
MPPIRRVFISHTSEFTKYPEKKSFIDAAVAAVIRAGCVPCDMEYFTAQDEKPAQYCIDQVRECDVYVGIIGFRYGSPVRDRSEVSYTELEFEAASQAPSKKRLVFLLNPSVTGVPLDAFSDLEYGVRQKALRTRLSNAGVTCKPFSDFHELEKLIYQALVEEVFAAPGASHKPEQIDWPKDKSPYRGLLWFNQEYAPLFFGRDREVDELVAKMSEPGGRALLVIGASGSGKSSVVAAGVRQAVTKQGRLPGSTQWVWQRIQPSDGDTPCDALARGLKETFQLSARPRLTPTGPTLRDLLSQHLSQGQELILFVDQFEELFTRGFHEPDIQTFLEQLIGTAQDQTNRLRVVATIRSEFLGKLEAYESTLNLLNSPYRYHLGLVSPRMLQDMIEKPAEATGYTFDPGLVERILHDTGQEPGNLALVEYALKQLFERRKGRAFTGEAYMAIGGVVGAIATKANDVLSGLEEDVRGAFDAVFAELVHLERERPPTRSRASYSAFSADESSVQLIEALAGQDCRVLVTSGSGPETIVEVAHEKLFSAWKKLKDWIDNSDADLRLIDFEEECAKRWHEQGCRVQSMRGQEQAVAVQRALRRFKKTPSAQLQTMMHPQEMLIERLNDASLSHQDRLLIGQKLAEFGDPRPGVVLRDGLPDIEWIEIPGGRVKVKDVKKSFTVKRFRIARYPVTNAQFEAFINAEDGYQNLQWWAEIRQSKAPEPPEWKEANSPREKLSWFEAVAFCRWLSQRTGSKIRLPTEWEWQQAAIGGDPTRDYPWPGEWDATHCNSSESRLSRATAVGIYPSGATKQGVLDMAGNVWEWCLNKYEDSGMPTSLRIDKSNSHRVIRGGSWNDFPGDLLVSARYSYSAVYRLNYVGFRLVQDIP